jgi:hypothetical protein
VIEALALGALASQHVGRIRSRIEQEREAIERLRRAEEAERERIERERLLKLQRRAADDALTIARLAAVEAHAVVMNATFELEGVFANEAARRALNVARAAATAAGRQKPRMAIVEEFAAKIKQQMEGAADALADRAREFAANQAMANQCSKSLLHQQISGLTATVSTLACERSSVFDVVSEEDIMLSTESTRFQTASSSRTPSPSTSERRWSPYQQSQYRSLLRGNSSPSSETRSNYFTSLHEETTTSRELPNRVDTRKGTLGVQSQHRFVASPSPPRRSPTAKSYFNLIAPETKTGSRVARSSPDLQQTFTPSRRFPKQVRRSPASTENGRSPVTADNSGVVQMVLEATASHTRREVHVSRRGSVDVALM